MRRAQTKQASESASPDTMRKVTSDTFETKATASPAHAEAAPAPAPLPSDEQAIAKQLERLGASAGTTATDVFQLGSGRTGRASAAERAMRRAKATEATASTSTPYTTPAPTAEPTTVPSLAPAPVSAPTAPNVYDDIRPTGTGVELDFPLSEQQEMDAAQERLREMVASSKAAIAQAKAFRMKPRQPHAAPGAAPESDTAEPEGTASPIGTPTGAAKTSPTAMPEPEPEP